MRVHIHFGLKYQNIGKIDKIGHFDHPHLSPCTFVYAFYPILFCFHCSFQQAISWHNWFSINSCHQLGLASFLGHNTWNFIGTLSGTTPERSHPHASTISLLLHNSNIFQMQYDTMPLVKSNCLWGYTHRYGTKCQIIGIIPQWDILASHFSVPGLLFKILHHFVLFSLLFPTSHLTTQLVRYQLMSPVGSGVIPWP